MGFFPFLSRLWIFPYMFSNNVTVVFSSFVFNLEKLLNIRKVEAWIWVGPLWFHPHQGSYCNWQLLRDVKSLSMAWRLLVCLHCMGDNTPIGIWKILAGFSELLIDTKEKRTWVWKGDGTKRTGERWREVAVDEYNLDTSYIKCMTFQRIDNCHFIYFFPSSFLVFFCLFVC